jgi:drug/metabolite transporter (DMT)-like permease
VGQVRDRDDDPVTTEVARSAVNRPPARDVAWLAVGVAAVSTSAPLIAATAAPALAIAFWRNLLGTAALSPVVLVRCRREITHLSRSAWTWSLVSGGLLAGHFATWIPSINLTSVASSTALIATQPAWVALIARARGQVVPRRAWLGMLVAFSGVLVITGVDLSLSAQALAGDVLALIGAVFAAGYVTVGSEVRREVSTWTYTFLVYATTSLVLLVLCLLTTSPLTGYSVDTWVKLFALTLGAQLLGHTVFNAVLKTTAPIVMSLAILFEMPGAALIAWWWLGQVPPSGVIPGAVLLLVGIAVVVSSGRRGDPATVPPVE